MLDRDSTKKRLDSLYHVAKDRQFVSSSSWKGANDPSLHPMVQAFKWLVAEVVQEQAVHYAHVGLGTVTTLDLDDMVRFTLEHYERTGAIAAFIEQQFAGDRTEARMLFYDGYFYRSPNGYYGPFSCLLCDKEVISWNAIKDAGASWEKLFVLLQAHQDAVHADFVCI